VEYRVRKICKYNCGVFKASSIVTIVPGYNNVAFLRVWPLVYGNTFKHGHAHNILMINCCSNQVVCGLVGGVNINHVIDDIACSRVIINTKLFSSYEIVAIPMRLTATEWLGDNDNYIAFLTVQ
jgi:hypothetical protein